MWVTNTLPDNICVINFMLDDNGALDPAFKESLEQLKLKNPAKYKRFVKAMWDVREKTGGEWYHEFDYLKHTRSKEEGGVPFLPDIPEVHGTYDFNTVPYMTLLLFQLQRASMKLQIRFFKEYCYANPSNSTAKVSEAAAKDYLMPFRKSFTYHGDRQGENRVEGEGNFRRFDRVRSTLAPFLHSRSNGVNKAVVVSAIWRDFINDVLAGNVPDVEVLIDEEKCPNLVKDLGKTVSKRRRPKTQTERFMKRTATAYLPLPTGLALCCSTISSSGKNNGVGLQNKRARLLRLALYCFTLKSAKGR